MTLYTHLKEQPFIVATGLAALVHSTWALGTLFNGEPPRLALSLEFVYWFVPAFLIGVALDVGQISTSHRIGHGERTRANYATFFTLAFATYFLQWLYMAHHMPALNLGAGVRESWTPFVQLMRDAALWVIPALLPLSTTLYTLSAGTHQPAAPDVRIAAPPLPAQEALPTPTPALAAWESELEDDTQEVIAQVFEEASAQEVAPSPAPLPNNK